MRREAPLVALVVALLTVASVPANPRWAPTYPKPGTKAGTIAAKGTFRLPAGSKTTGKAEVAVWPVGGGLQETKTFQVPANKTGKLEWGEVVIGSLTPGQTYHCRVTIEVKDGAGKTSEWCPSITEVAAR